MKHSQTGSTHFLFENFSRNLLKRTTYLYHVEKTLSLFNNQRNFYFFNGSFSSTSPFVMLSFTGFLFSPGIVSTICFPFVSGIKPRYANTSPVLKQHITKYGSGVHSLACKIVKFTITLIRFQFCRPLARHYYTQSLKFKFTDTTATQYTYCNEYLWRECVANTIKCLNETNADISDSCWK